MLGTLAVVLLALFAATMFAATNVLSRIGFDRATVRQSLPITYGVTALAIDALAFATSRPLEIPLGTAALFAFDGVLNFVAVFVLFVSIIRLGPSTASAIKNIAPLPAIVLSALLLREPIYPLVYLGALVTVSGVLLLSIEPGKGNSPWRRDVLLPLFGALIFASDNVLRRYAVQQVDDALLGPAVAMPVSFGLALAWSLLAGDRLASPRPALFFALAGVTQALAVLSLYTAFQSGLVAVVLPLANSTPVFVLLASALLVRDLETLNWRIVAGVFAVVVGVALISLAH